MRTLLLSAVLALSTSAFAQTPINLDFGANKASDKYLAADTPSVRFLGEETAGATFLTGDGVEVLYEEDGMVRVRKGSKYGWVKASALTDEAPPRPAAAPLELPALAPLAPMPTTGGN